MEAIRPQAKEIEDERTLELCKDIEKALEDEKPMRVINLSKELKEIAEQQGYIVDLD